jgi:hypothetical protein
MDRNGVNGNWTNRFSIGLPVAGMWQIFSVASVKSACCRSAYFRLYFIRPLQCDHRNLLKFNGCSRSDNGITINPKQAWIMYIYGQATPWCCSRWISQPRPNWTGFFYFGSQTSTMLCTSCLGVDKNRWRCHKHPHIISVFALWWTCLSHFCCVTFIDCSGMNGKFELICHSASLNATSCRPLHVF